MPCAPDTPCSAALWEHDEALRSGDAHDLLGDRFLLVTHVRSGESIAVPERFELSLIRKLLPGDDLDEAADALRGIAAGIADEFSVAQEVRFTAPRDHPVGGTPDEVPPDHPGVEALARSITATTGAAARIEGAPYWSEKPLLHAVGIPGVYFAAGDIAHCHTPFETPAGRSARGGGPHPGPFRGVVVRSDGGYSATVVK